ncbi:hypothetical protein WKW79_36775, partial [Variovorax robiniae]
LIGHHPRLNTFRQDLDPSPRPMRLGSTVYLFTDKFLASERMKALDPHSRLIVMGWYLPFQTSAGWLAFASNLDYESAQLVAASAPEKYGYQCELKKSESKWSVLE